MPTRRHWFVIALLPWVAVALISTPAPAQVKTRARKMVAATLAGKHVGEDCRVLFKAARGGKLDDGSFFLCSTAEADDPKGFWVIFAPEALEAYCSNLSLPPEYVTAFYANASVRVDGKIVARPAGQKGMSIVVTDPEQLELQVVNAENAGNRVGDALRVRMTVNFASLVNDGKSLNLHSMDLENSKLSQR